MHLLKDVRRGGCLVKGLVILVVLVIVVALVIKFWVIPKAAGWIADGARYVLVEGVKEMRLPSAQESRIIQDIDRVTNEYKAGRITTEQLAHILEEIDQSPLLHMGAVYMIQALHIDRSGLSDAQKEDATRAVQRFARGIYEGQLPGSAMEQLQAPIYTTDQDGHRHVKETLTDEELLALVDELKQKADEAGVPDEAFEFDIAEEFHQAINRALNQATIDQDEPSSDAALPEQG